MAPFNLFLFLALALAGCVTVYLYRLDSEDDERMVPTAHRVAAPWREPDRRRAIRNPEMCFASGRRADMIAFFDLPSESGPDGGSDTRLLTDFLVDAGSMHACREASGRSRCA